jgi:protoporphyrinogen oxidase
VGRIRTGVASVPGLYVTGNYLNGIGIGDCVREAAATANDVASFVLQRRGFAARLSG